MNTNTIAGEIATALATRGYYEVSEGSLCEDDLIVAFMAALEQLHPVKATAIKEDPEYTWIFARLAEDGTLGNLDDEDQADVAYFLWEYLWAELSNAAPAGCVFTTSEGNASLFWFIKHELVKESIEQEEAL